MLYKVSFGQPISQGLLMSLNFPSLSTKNDSDLDSLFLLTREAQGKSLLNDFHEQRQALSRYCVGAVVLSEPVVSVIRRELKRLSPDVKIDLEEIARVLTEEVIKRDIFEGTVPPKRSEKYLGQPENNFAQRRTRMTRSQLTRCHRHRP